ncbi:MAG: dihydrofolate reductase family protein [Actinomycetota bacterium]|nr:dihydrofolate reductase family protein [Acidimicrobiia bacterium]MDQ3292867.1 dihydrofolate reductase family protein [Actinomycetota bacterium]
MANVIVDLSTSLDGYIAGPNDGRTTPLGDGGGALFEWMGAGPEANRVDPRICPPDASRPVVDEWQAEAGAMVSGRRTFDIAGGWKDGHPIDVPIFVVTHEPPTDGEWSPQVEFVTEGVERAIARAKEVAGDNKVSLAAASVVQQALRAGLVDEMPRGRVPRRAGGPTRR